MPIKDKLDVPLQESLLTLLAYDNINGGIAAKLLNPIYFEGDYADIARRCIDYHLRYNEAPGSHIDDIFADMLVKRDDNRHLTYRHTLTNLLKLYDTGINTHYLLDETREFTRLQRTRQLLLDASNRLASRQQRALSEVDDIVYDILRTRRETTSIGMRLTDTDRLFAYMKRQRSEFRLGIPQLDERRVCPSRGTVMLALGPSGAGKSWLMVHIGRSALLGRFKVLHVSLEMSEEQVSQRYLQNLYTIAIRDVRTRITRATETTLTNRTKSEPDFQVNVDMKGQFPFYNTSDDGDQFEQAREELQARFQWSGSKIDNLLIKRWAPSTLTVMELSAHLDMLERIEHFAPDIVLVDYLGLMKISTSHDKEYRHALGQILVDLRGLAVERNIAMVVAQQVSREGAKAQLTENVHVAEDWSLIGTSDYILTISVTKAEKELGLCRLFVSKARDTTDKFGVVLTQNYALGQFVIDSISMHPRYYEMLTDVTARHRGKDDVEDEDDGT